MLLHSSRPLVNHADRDTGALNELQNTTTKDEAGSQLARYSPPNPCAARRGFANPVVRVRHAATCAGGARRVRGDERPVRANQPGDLRGERPFLLIYRPADREGLYLGRSGIRPRPDPRFPAKPERAPNLGERHGPGRLARCRRDNWTVPGEYHVWRGRPFRHRGQDGAREAVGRFRANALSLRRAGWSLSRAADSGSIGSA